MRIEVLVLVLFVLSFTSCRLDEKEKLGWWACADGGCPADIMRFDEKNLRHDTLFARTKYGNDTAFAKIYSSEKKLFTVDLIWIRYFFNKQTARYYKVDKHGNPKGTYK